jgi:antitoxin component of MazEF toxin-antitoxin module
MKIFKWDSATDDLGVIIPDEVIAGLGLQEGDEVHISANPDGSIMIARTSVKANDGEVSAGD